MPPKVKTRTVTLGDEARTKILSGARIVYEAVKSTYSPLSGNVAIENLFNERSTISHDGVTVARAITLKDPVENIGARLLVDASMKTNDIAGDGTSATVILAYHILHEAQKRLAAGFNAMQIKRGIEEAAKQAKKYIEDMAVSCDNDKLKDVAGISAADKELGKLIADTIIDVGPNGGITVEEYQGIGVESEIVEGFYFGKGYDSPYFMTDPVDESAHLENCQVLVVEDKITNIDQLKDILEKVANSDNKRILIIGDVSGQALHSLVVNKLKNLLQVASVAPALFGDQRQLHLEDMAVLTGGRVVLAGTAPGQIDESYLGMAKSVVISRDSTTIIADKPKAVLDRIKRLQKHVGSESNQFRKDNMKKRLAMLEGRIAIIRVGGESEAIAHEKKMRVDDAVHATQAARDSGIVPGGAVSMVCAAQSMREDPHGEGHAIVIEALEQPFIQLMLNAGLPAEYNLVAVKKAPQGYGYNVFNRKSAEPIDLMSEGVVDPALVISQVIENGCAAAALALTNNATITYDKDEQHPDNATQL